MKPRDSIILMASTTAFIWGLFAFLAGLLPPWATFAILAILFISAGFTGLAIREWRVSR